MYSARAIWGGPGVLAVRIALWQYLQLQYGARNTLIMSKRACAGSGLNTRLPWRIAIIMPPQRRQCQHGRRAAQIPQCNVFNQEGRASAAA